MTQSALKTAGFLLLLASIIQGLQDVPVFHYKTKEVLVSQNTSLPCFIKNSSANIYISSSEWSKKDISKKLTLYTAGFDSITFVPKFILETINTGKGDIIGTSLEVTNITKADAGTYVCTITTYPSGSLRTETELIVKDEIECDMNSTIEVNSGQNITIPCNEFPNVTYTWFKDGMQVSNRSSLQLLSVSEASAGIYTLSANTGNRRLQATFNIKVFTQTTDYWAGSTSVSPYYNSSGSRSEATSFSPSTVSGTADTLNSTPTATVSFSQSTESQNTTFSTVYASPNYTQSQTSEVSNQSATHHTTVKYNQSGGFENVTNVSPHSNSSQAVNTDMSYNHSGTTPHYTSTEYAVINDTDSTLNKTQLPDDSVSKAFTSAVSTVNASLGATGGVKTGASLTSTPGSTTDAAAQQDPKSEGQSPLVLTLSIIGGALLIIIVLVLVRRRMNKKRMDLPPPFKPPPPPIKYTAVRNPQQQFPTDRCNSITAGGSMEMRHTFV